MTIITSVNTNVWIEFPKIIHSLTFFYTKESSSMGCKNIITRSKLWNNNNSSLFFSQNFSTNHNWKSISCSLSLNILSRILAPSTLETKLCLAFLISWQKYFSDASVNSCIWLEEIPMTYSKFFLSPLPTPFLEFCSDQTLPSLWFSLNNFVDDVVELEFCFQHWQYQKKNH